MGISNSCCMDLLDNQHYIVQIKTGDTKGAGLHDTVYISLINTDDEVCEELELRGFCMTVFKKGHSDKFKVYQGKAFPRITKIMIGRREENFKVDWYVEKVVVYRPNDISSPPSIFPVHRWISNKSFFIISEFDATLPQMDAHREQRVRELTLKQFRYKYVLTPRVPPQIEVLPEDEIYSDTRKWDILHRRLTCWSRYRLPTFASGQRWPSLDSIAELFKERGRLPQPNGFNVWEDDYYFAYQRVAGCFPIWIKLMTHMPHGMNIDPNSVKVLILPHTMEEAIDQERLFIVDLEILQGIVDQKKREVCAPRALFYLGQDRRLKPVAIQLFRDVDTCQVYYPSDPPHVWKMAKMWFNNAEAAVQRAYLTGIIHMVLESVAIATHRQLSPSHPVFRLLMTCFKSIFSVNRYELCTLFEKGGWIDMTYNAGKAGIIELIAKIWEHWQFDSSDFVTDMKTRRVLDEHVLPDYPYRDDGLLLHEALREYVETIVNLYYDADERLQQDWELQNWAKELRYKQGANIKGLPGEGYFHTREDLVKVLTTVLFMSSVQHAALTLPLYDECAFLPNYPTLLEGCAHLLEIKDHPVLEGMPCQQVSMEIIVINFLLSERDNGCLSDLRPVYLYYPPAQEARHRLISKLQKISDLIDQRNQSRRWKYDYLNPASAPT